MTILFTNTLRALMNNEETGFNKNIYKYRHGLEQGGGMDYCLVPYVVGLNSNLQCERSTIIWIFEQVRCKIKKYCVTRMSK